MPATAETADAASTTTGSVFRDAFRLLCILLEGSEPFQGARAGAEGFDRIFHSKRAQALVFYVCYPDYLADRLLDLHDAGEPGSPR